MNKESVFQTADSHCDHTGQINSAEGAESNKHHIFSFQIINTLSLGSCSLPCDFSIHFLLEKSSIIIKEAMFILVILHKQTVLTAFLQVLLSKFHRKNTGKINMNFSVFKVSFSALFPRPQGANMNFFLC